jgi:hypothetical protein
MFIHLENEKICYFKHFKRALKLSLMCLQASFYLFIHAIYPDVYEYTGTQIIKNINNNIKDK